MNRLNFFTSRAGGEPTTTATDPDTADPYSDRTPLSPRAAPMATTTTTAAAEILPDPNDDLEAAHPSPAAAAATREMAERSTPGSRFLSRFRPAIPSFFNSASSSRPQHHPHPAHHHHPDDDEDGEEVEGLYAYGGGGGNFRPTSSAYSGAGLRGAPDTVIDGGYGAGRGGYGNLDGVDGLESPKSPEFLISERSMNLPGTRLHLPGMERTWTVGSNGPPTRPGTGVAVPEPAVVRDGRRERGGRSRSGSGSSEDGSAEGGGEGRGHRERRKRRRRERSGRSGSGRSRRSGRSGRSGSHRSSGSSSEGSRTERGTRRRRAVGEHGSRTSSRRPPKHFLFCFPWIKSRRIRSQILRCFVSGMFLALTLSIYLSLSLTQAIDRTEFTILLIIIILFVTIFFCHSLIRLCMLVVKQRKRDQMAQRGQLLPEMVGPGSGYAVPREPIPVVLARDEEAAGIESEATKTGPPAYGVWRESVRVDPNRLYWMRNEQATPAVEEEFETSSSSGSSGSGFTGSTGSTESSHSSHARTTVPRPPSYSSDDGVSYVVEARPRSMAPPRANGPPAVPHPSESGMSGSWV